MAKFSTVAELLEDESRWTKNVLARNAAGEPRYYNQSDASCWCIAGAILLVYGDANGPCQRIYEAMGVRGWAGMVEFNNTRTHAEVLAAVRKAGI